MELVRRFAFQVAVPREKARAVLEHPELVFASLPGLEGLRREGERLLGRLCGEAPIFGKVCFPFQSRLELEEAVRLLPEPLDEPFWAELGGKGEVAGEGLAYEVHLVLHAEIPEGPKWGTRALARMAEAALRHNLSRALAALPQRIELGALG